MQEAQMKEERQRVMSERRAYGDRCFEKWHKKPDVGQKMLKMYEANPDKARGLSMVMENQEMHLTKLTETEISSSFQTTPENVMRIVRLGYPNSVRGELFMEWPMQTARDSMYYLKAVYGSATRGATANSAFIESSTHRYASEVEEDSIGTGDASTTAFSATLTVYPLRRYSVNVLVDNEPVGNDNGSGTLTGDGLDSTSTNTIDYDTGAIVLNFDTAPDSDADIVVQYNLDSEDSTLYDEVKEVKLYLTDYQFRAKPMPIYFSYSKMTELLLGTTLEIDVEEAMVRNAADELKKSLDFMAIRMAYRYSLTNDAITYSAALSGGETRVHKATQFSEAMDQAGDAMHDDLMRGGASYAFGSPKAVSFLKLHDRFNATGVQPKVGAFRVGSIDDVGIYKVPKALIGNVDNRIIIVYKNELQPEDVSLAFGSLIPLYKTPKMEYRQFYSEQGLAHFGDAKALQPKYLRIINITSL